MLLLIAKAALEKDLEKKRVERKTLSTQIQSAGAERQKIGDEINSLRTQRDKHHDDMNRIKVNLVYNTRGEYEDMIRRHENSMRNNGRTFSAIEEARILNDIRQLRHGISQLEQYEHLKNSYDRLNDSFRRKKLELDEAWRAETANRAHLAALIEQIKAIQRHIGEVNAELDESTKRRVELKKAHEDLIRENIVRQQKARKTSVEKVTKKIKEDEIVQSMESTIKDYNKLITYYNKLSSLQDDSSDQSSSFGVGFGLATTPIQSPSSGGASAFKSSLAGTASNSPLLEDHSFSSLPVHLHTDDSAAAAVEEESSQTRPVLQKPNTLSLSNERRLSKQLLSPSPSCAQLLTPTPTLSFSLCINSPGGDEPPGTFVMKKKLDEDELNASGRWSLSARKRYGPHGSRKSKSNKVKISHSVEVINLLGKLNIPIQMSCQVDECLKLLTSRRDQVQCELNLYKSNQLAIKSSPAPTPTTQTTTQTQTQTKTTPIQTTDKPQTIETPPKSQPPQTPTSAKSSNETTRSTPTTNDESRSEISSSSCMDSNYESDNNSAVASSTSSSSQFLSSSNMRDELAAMKFGLVDQLALKPASIKTLLPSHIDSKLLSGVSKQAAALTSSDESDATLNESINKSDALPAQGLLDMTDDLSLDERSSTTKKPIGSSHIKLGTFSSSSSNNSDTNTIAPGSPKTPTPLSASLTAESEPMATKSAATASSDTETPSAAEIARLKIARQLSDGYASSCTPLSASSINNELPTSNPFFQTSNRSPP